MLWPVADWNMRGLRYFVKRRPAIRAGMLTMRRMELGPMRRRTVRWDYAEIAREAGRHGACPGNRALISMAAHAAQCFARPIRGPAARA